MQHPSRRVLLNVLKSVAWIAGKRVVRASARKGVWRIAGKRSDGEEGAFAMASRGDKQFGEIALRQGFITKEQLATALSALDDLESKGIASSIDRVLAENGILETSRIEAVRQVQKRRIEICPCGNRMNVFGYPPGKKLHCSKCRKPFEVSASPIAETPCGNRNAPGLRRAADRSRPASKPGLEDRESAWLETTPSPLAHTPTPAVPADNAGGAVREGGGAAPAAPFTTPSCREEADSRMSPGQKIGRYEILSVLGAGGMGVVYKARHVLLDRTDALKVIRPDVAARSDFKVMFLREAKLASKLVHPHITRVYDWIDEGGKLGFSMAFVDGRSLSELLKTGPLPLRESLAWMVQIADALVLMHSQGLVHRDIKPANIMVDSQDKAILTDFGLAKNFKEAGASGVTKDDDLVGTPAFMAPEQIDSARFVDGRADLYSLGATLFAMLTGEPPFTGYNHIEVLGKVLTKEPPKLSSRLPSAPASLEELFGRILLKNPNFRIGTAREVKSALEEILGETA